jgi:2-methylisocitrate lyase-like PEP mutase family enzyme
MGRPDGARQLSREETLANARAIVAATPLPVSGDLESCYAATEEEIAETIRLAADTGLVGGSIDDATGDPNAPILPFETAVRRVSAAVEAAPGAAIPIHVPFMLTARAENFLYGIADLDDTIHRLRAFQEVGAGVL